MELRILAVVLSATIGLGNLQAGLYSGTWNSVGGNAVSDTLSDTFSSDLDIVGDSSHPALQYAQDSSYIYLRVQVASASLPSAPAGSYMFYIDRVGVGTTDYPDFAFAMDYKSNDTGKHGLEMTRSVTGAADWAHVTISDIDGDPSAKLTTDINGVNGTERPGDGSWDTVTGTGYGNTTRSYVEVKVSWDYLMNYSTTGLGPNQTWRVAAGTINNKTDHNTIASNGDMLGFDGLTTTPFSGGWSADISAVPEIPASPWFVLGFIGLVVFGGRLRSSAAGWVHRKAH